LQQTSFISMSTFLIKEEEKCPRHITWQNHIKIACHQYNRKGKFFFLHKKSYMAPFKLSSTTTAHFKQIL